MPSDVAAGDVARLVVPADLAALAFDVRRAVQRRDAACIVEGLPLDDDHRSLLTLGRHLGTLAVDSVIRVGGEPVAIYIQRVEHNDDRHRTNGGQVRLSATAAEFPCHTDCAADEIVPDLVMLHCARRDPRGGASIVVPLDALVSHLPRGVLNVLTQRRFRYPFGLAAVIEAGDSGLRVRYNRHEIDKAGPLEAEAAEALEVLDDVLTTSSCRAELSLARGDCLVVDNHRALHGRRAFARSSGRLLYRARVFT
jgi:Taurine catabolism dioxygenase TauD, TfdA family